jgi:hypothetical protein
MDTPSPDLIRAIGSMITSLATLLVSAAALVRALRRRR